MKSRSLRSKTSVRAPRSIRRSSAFSKFKGLLPVATILALVGCGGSDVGSNPSIDSKMPTISCTPAEWDSCSPMFEVTDDDPVAVLPDCHLILVTLDPSFKPSNNKVTFELFSPQGDLSDSVTLNGDEIFSSDEGLPSIVLHGSTTSFTVSLKFVKFAFDSPSQVQFSITPDSCQ